MINKQQASKQLQFWKHYINKPNKKDRHDSEANYIDITPKYQFQLQNTYPYAYAVYHIKN